MTPPFRCPRAPPSRPFTFLSSHKSPVPKIFLLFFTFLSAVQIICFSAYYLVISDKFANFGKVFREIFCLKIWRERKNSLPLHPQSRNKRFCGCKTRKSSLKEFHRQRKDVVQEPDGFEICQGRTKETNRQSITKTGNRSQIR